MDKTKYPLPHPQVAATVIDDQAVVILADAGEVNVFNPVGTRIWQLIDGSHSIQQIVDTIVDEYDVSPETALQDTENFVQALIQARAIVLQDPPAVS